MHLWGGWEPRATIPDKDGYRLPMFALARIPSLTLHVSAHAFRVNPDAEKGDEP
jgi:hypothetical protein